MKTIVIDAGHGGKDPGACGLQLQEKNVVLKMSQILGNKLENYFRIIHTRPGDTYIELNERARIANNSNADLFVSLHCNAAENRAAKGIETLVYKNTGDNKKIAELVQQNLIATTGAVNRGIKERPDLCVLNSTKMTAILIELCFISSADEEMLLKNDKFLDKCIEALANSVLTYFGIKEIPSTNDINILGNPTVTVAQMKAWASLKGATETFIAIADIFHTVSKAAGVNPAVSYCQSAKETGFGKFGGVLDESYYNTCGMKASAGGGDYDASAHKRFNNWAEGISAQVDHLALYAGADGYPLSFTHDPRHFPYLKGTATTAEALGGKWAPSVTYGKELGEMIKQLESTEVKVSTQLESAIQILVENKVICDPDYWRVKGAEVQHLDQLILNMANRLRI